MSANSSNVSKVYRSVIDDVISNMRESFLDEGVDEQVLIELKQMWENKLVQSKALEVAETKLDMVVSNERYTSSSESQQQKQSQQQQTNQRQQQNSAAMSVVTTTQPIRSAAGMVQPTVLQYAAQSGADNQKTVTLTMPHQTVNTVNGPQKVTIALPAHMGQGSLPTVMSSPAATATLALPPDIAASLLQQPGALAALNHAGIITTQQPQNISIPTGNGQRIQYQTIAVSQPSVTTSTTQSLHQFNMQTSQPNQTNSNPLVQLDGAHDTSDEEEDDFNEDDQQDDADDDQNDDENDEEGEEEEPLNSEDDVSDEDPSDLFDTENVVVCQYDKITRCRNKWKFHLKDGIMSLKGRDYVFHKSVGDAEW